jgi:hypothetical protein
MTQPTENEARNGLPFVFLTLHNGSPLGIDPELIEYWNVREYPEQYKMETKTITNDDGSSFDHSVMVLGAHGEPVVIAAARVLTNIQVGEHNFDVTETFEEVVRVLQEYQARRTTYIVETRDDNE